MFAWLLGTSSHACTLAPASSRTGFPTVFTPPLQTCIHLGAANPTTFHHLTAAVAALNWHDGTLEVFTRGSMNKSAPLVSWKNAFAAETKQGYTWRLDEAGTKVAVIGKALGQPG